MTNAYLHLDPDADLWALFGSKSLVYGVQLELESVSVLQPRIDDVVTEPRSPYQPPRKHGSSSIDVRLLHLPCLLRLVRRDTSLLFLYIMKPSLGRIPNLDLC